MKKNPKVIKIKLLYTVYVEPALLNGSIITLQIYCVFGNPINIYNIFYFFTQFYKRQFDKELVLSYMHTPWSPNINDLEDVPLQTADPADSTQYHFHPALLFSVKSLKIRNELPMLLRIFVVYKDWFLPGL